MQGVAYLLDIVGVKYGVAQEADNQRSLMNWDQARFFAMTGHAQEVDNQRSLMNNNNNLRLQEANRVLSGGDSF